MKGTGTSLAQPPASSATANAAARPKLPAELEVCRGKRSPKITQSTVILWQRLLSLPIMAEAGSVLTGPS
ncbi:MAG: hypothetical protein KIS70_12600 [Xanthobacteraceae bacterium]|nr:hypothetical protein [Xanthobacteraceae bacterium]